MAMIVDDEDLDRRLTEAGDQRATVRHARRLLRADPPDADQAIGWLEPVARQGSAAAMLQLREALIMVDRRVEAGEWLQRAVERGHPDAMFVSARRLGGRPTTWQQEKVLLERAAASGHARAALRLAQGCWRAPGIELETGRVWYERLLAESTPTRFRSAARRERRWELHRLFDRVIGAGLASRPTDRAVPFDQWAGPPYWTTGIDIGGTPRAVFVAYDPPSVPRDWAQVRLTEGMLADGWFVVRLREQPASPLDVTAHSYAEIPVDGDHPDPAGVLAGLLTVLAGFEGRGPG